MHMKGNGDPSMQGNGDPSMSDDYHCISCFSHMSCPQDSADSFAQEWPWTKIRVLLFNINYSATRISVHEDFFVGLSAKNRGQGFSASQWFCTSKSCPRPTICSVSCTTMAVDKGLADIAIALSTCTFLHQEVLELT